VHRKMILIPADGPRKVDLEIPGFLILIRSGVQKTPEKPVFVKNYVMLYAADVRCSAPRRSPVVANWRSILDVDVHANAR